MVRSSWHGVEKDTEKLMQMKKKVAVFVTSNCNYGSNVEGRLRLAQEMVDLGLKLDRFGRCFPGSKATMPKTSRDSRDFYRFLEQYKFYLSFENSLHCRDYITEKFIANGLAAGLLPIVFGAVKADYLAIAPKHSFIHVEDFNSTKELVDYINYLDGNDTAYREYFKWRSGDAGDFYHHGRANGFCALCRALHGIHPDDTRSYADIYGTDSERYPGHVVPGVNQTIPSIHKWWHVDESRECLNVTRDVT